MAQIQTYLFSPLLNFQQISLSAFSFIFSELVQYCEHRVQLVSELQTKLSELGYSVGQRVVDTLLIREKNYKRETRLINMLIFIRSKVWITLFGKEADKLEQANDDKNTCKKPTKLDPKSQFVVLLTEFFL